MVLKVNYKNYINDLYIAAINDDVAQMQACLDAGASLDIQSSDYLMKTPVCVAIEHSSQAFLRLAFEIGFNPWLLDNYERNAFDTAWLKGEKSLQIKLFNLMYPTDGSTILLEPD